MTYNPNYPVSADVLANPTALTNRDDAGFELHGVISRIQDILEALEAKVGIGASTPPATAAVLRRTATGASGWAQAQPGDIAPGGVVNSVLQSLNGTVAGFAAITAPLFAAGAVGQILGVNSANQVGASTSAVQIPGTVLNWTSLGKPCVIIASLRDLSASANGISLTANLYDGAVATLFMINETLADTITHRTVTCAAFFTPTAGAHSFSLYWNVSAPQVFVVNTALIVAELH